ncbi:Ig-like domain-containing protein, partial [Hoeflea sp. BAL378]|uniref:Ig-like domain-containing protein n=1 Tax=Hoeflea sp. BAL378 TaxID=1547437 RepID=UPI001FCBA64B
MNKNNAGFLAFVAVGVAAAIGAFFVSPKLFKAEVEAPGQSAPASTVVGDGAGEAPATAPADAGTEVASAEPAEPAGADAWIVPSFDVLRVEPDGSTVIAGKAEPGTTLNIMNGDAVVASTQVGPSGDFAAVLDTPLGAGDYQLTLEIVGKDGATRRSEEVATVSIPKDADGELLAMVSKPGKASRIIAQPAAPEGDMAAADQAAGGEPQADTPVEVASSTPDAAAETP